MQGTGEREFTLFTNRRLYNLRSPTEENRDLWVASISILKSFYAEREAKIEGEGVKRKSHKRMTSNSKDIKRVSGLLKRD